MTPERWQQVREILHAALERTSERRALFLAEACVDDDELRSEVNALLSAHGNAGKFLVTPVLAISAQLCAPLAAGTRLGPYEILDRIGAGGMGEVYRGRDSRLERTVAIKILSGNVIHDPYHRQRFLQEARAASALSHPNIVTLHDIGSDSGVDFFVMEYVPEKSLDRLISAKPLPLAEVLDYGIQIASALAAAHSAAIIHRDIKPANIMVTPHRQVKVLDFGLAKSKESQDIRPASKTQTTNVLLTEAGKVMGTVAYMSPEQARGERVDARTDLFSFGAVLYEMATARRAFPQSWDWTPPSAAGVDPSLFRIILKLIHGDSEQRYASADDVAADLKRLQQALQSGQSRRRRLNTIAVLALLASLSAFIWLATRHAGGPSPQAFMQLTDNPGEELYPSLAPDGKSLVYQSRASGKWEIYLKRVGGQNPISLTKGSGSDDTQPAISPDGEQVAFRSEREGGGIFLMGTTGQKVRRLTRFGYNPAWSPDGSEVVWSTGFFSRPEERPTRDAMLFRVNVATGKARRVSGIDDAVQPNWSPHGYRIAYWTNPKGFRDIWTVAAGGGDPVPVTADVAIDWSPFWSPDGRYLYFSSDRGGSMNLWRVRIDEVSGKTLGAPEQFTMPAQYSGLASFSRDGRHLAYVAHARDLNLYKVGFDPSHEASSGESVAVTTGSTPLADPDFSPDGQWIAFNSHMTPQNLFLVRSDGTGLRQLADGGQMDRCPRWSPDGSQIVFCSARTGKYQIWTIKPDGSSIDRRTDTPGTGARIPIWSPDGRVLYRTSGVILDPANDWKDQPLQRLPNPEFGTAFAADSWSPDGRMVAGELSQNDGGFLGVSVYHVDSQTYERIGPPGPAPNARWLPDSRRLLFLHDGKLNLIDSQTKRIREVFTAGPRRDIFSFDLSKNGRWIAFTMDAAEADVWLVKTEP